jgi:GAF domain-containing protein
VSEVATREILTAGARALAGGDGLEPSLQILLAAIAQPFAIVSAAIVIANEGGDGLEIVATYGLDAAATAGLAEAIGRPTHPIARTYREPSATFDVAPTVPGGPALRSHLALVVTRGGSDTVLGVLALAHDRPIDADARPILAAVADLAAVDIERHRAR